MYKTHQQEAVVSSTANGVPTSAFLCSFLHFFPPPSIFHVHNYSISIPVWKNIYYKSNQKWFSFNKYITQFWILSLMWHTSIFFLPSALNQFYDKQGQALNVDLSHKWSRCLHRNPLPRCIWCRYTWKNIHLQISVFIKIPSIIRIIN